MRIAPALALLAALPLVLPGSASAQARPAAGDELRVSWPIDGAIVLVGGLTWLGTELAKEKLAPDGCRWCGRNEVDDSVARTLAWRDLSAGGTTSDVFALGVLPVVTLAGGTLAAWSDGRLGETPANALLVAEAVALSSVLNQLVKFAAGRERPFVADLPPDAKGRTASPADNDLSFYSGHSNLAFALVVSAGTVAELRGYRAAPYIWGVGLPLATFVAYSRLAAKKHYLSDVLLGSLAGAAAGVAVPFLHRAPKVSRGGASLSVAPAANGLVLSGTF